MVLGRGIVGDQGGRPTVACPQHRKTFDLATGASLSDPQHCIVTFPVNLEEGKVYLKLPPPTVLARLLGAIACVLLLAPGAPRAEGGDGFFASPSLYWMSGEHRVDIGASVRTRGEAWDAYANDTD